MLAKSYRIKNGKEYNNNYKYGKKINGKYVFVYFLLNRETYNRYGIVTNKAIGNAVRRNRVKRQIREIVRKNMKNISGHQDIVIVTKKNINNVPFFLIEQDVISIMKKAGLW